MWGWRGLGLEVWSRGQGDCGIGLGVLVGESGVGRGLGTLLAVYIGLSSWDVGGWKSDDFAGECKLVSDAHC